MSNTYKLQLRHGTKDKNFNKREEVIAYVENKMEFDKTTTLLPYEPVLFFYGAEGKKNAIIMVGLPEGETNEGKSFFLFDTADLKSKIEGLESIISEKGDFQKGIEAEAKARADKDAELEKAIADEVTAREKADTELKEAMAFTDDDITSIIEACGLVYNEKMVDGRVSYTPDNHDEVIRDAKSLADAIDKIAKFVVQLSNEMYVDVDDTDTVKLTLTQDENEGGNVITADVNIAGSEGLSKKNFDNNILGKTTDGLYASASIESSKEKQNALVFKTSGYVNGEFKVDAYETEVPLPVYSGDNGKKTGVTVSVDNDKDVISANLNVSSDEDNILKLVDGEYTVDGIAKNIKYKNSTVEKTLNEHSEHIEDIEDNLDFINNLEVRGSETDTVKTTVNNDKKGIFTVSNDVKLGTDKSIIVSNGGLKVNVSATYNKSRSILLIKVGDNDYPIDLSSLAFDVLKDASYDSTNEDIVLTFTISDKDKVVRIPAHDLVHELTAADTSSIHLVLEDKIGAQNVLTAKLLVNPSLDNILEVKADGVYVSKSHITNAVNAEATVRENAVKKLEDSVGDTHKLSLANKEAITTEETRATAAEKANANAISKEVERAVDKENVILEKVGNNTTLIAQKEEAAKTREAQVLADAKTYTNEEVVKVNNTINSEVAKTKEREGQVLADAKAYTDAETNSAKEREAKVLADSKVYTDNAISSVKSVVDTKANSADVVNTYATKTELTKVQDAAATKSDVHAVTEGLAGRVTANEAAIGNFNLSYDPATNKLTYTGKDGRAQSFVLANGSLLESGRFDESSNSVILVLKGSNGETKEISIPVSKLLTDINGRVVNAEGALSTINGAIAKLAKKFTVKPTSTVTLTKNTVGDEDELSANVRVSSGTKQGLKTDGEGLFVSNDLEDYTVVFGDEGTVSGQTAVSKLLTTTKSNKDKVESVSTEVGNVKNIAEKANSDLQSEIVRATRAEEANANAVVNEKNRAESKEKALEIALSTEVNKLDNSIKAKANAVDVFDKEEVTTKLQDYAKSADVQSKLNDKLNAADAKNVYATKEEVQGVKDGYATKVEVNREVEKLDQRVTSNQSAIDNFNLTYDAATSELTYVDKGGRTHTYKLYSGSLIKNGTFDSNSNSVVLTIETAGHESQVTIPVSALLSDINKNIKTNADAIKTINDGLVKVAKKWEVGNSGTVELNKTTTGDTDSLTANVRLASSNKQAIKAEANGLYVSNDFEDYTVVFGSEGTVSGQKAISKLLEVTNALQTTVSGQSNISDSALRRIDERVTANANHITDNKTEIDKLKEKVNTGSSDLTLIKQDISTNKDNINGLKTDVANNKADLTTLKPDVTNLKTKVTTLEGEIPTLKTKVTALEGDVPTLKTDVSDLKTKVTTLEGNVPTLKNDVSELKTKVGTLVPEVSTLNTQVQNNKNENTNLSNKINNLTQEFNSFQTNLSTKVNESVKISADPSNILEKKTDGLYVRNVFDAGEY